jgi:acyl-CoA synthetase (AMP-forming)/AMP-acid ligase II
MFDTQVSEIQSKYGIAPGGIDLGCFPLFALFNSAMGVTTVFPEMDFSRPASAIPNKLLAAANDWRVTQAFASPAVWRVLSEHCGRTGERIPSLTQVFSCGAPVPAHVLRATLTIVGDNARMHTPYGATECLPVSTIEAAEVLGKTAARTDQGAGVCVGRRFDSMDWRIIRITDGPIATIQEAEELPDGEIGELIVRGPQVSPLYVTRADANVTAKIFDMRAGASPPPGERLIENGGEDASPRRVPSNPARVESTQSGAEFWHRIGDVGYFDDQDRFWYCGRKSQRVETAEGPLFTECVEPVFSSLAGVGRAALVGVGNRGTQIPVIVIERDRSKRVHLLARDVLGFAKQNPATRQVQAVLFRSSLPVDVRHNAKINREQLTVWATKKLSRALSLPPAS